MADGKWPHGEAITDWKICGFRLGGDFVRRLTRMITTGKGLQRRKALRLKG